MGILDFITGKHFDEQTEEEQQAEEYILQDCTEDGSHVSALVRHYHVSETADILERHAGVRLTDAQTGNIVQRLRDKYGMGPIDEYNQPGYVDPDDYPEDQEAQREVNASRSERDAEIIEEQRGGGFLGWLFGK